MPIYEFRCHGCGRQFEELCRLGQTVQECPLCGSTEVSKQVSSFNAKSNGNSIGGTSGCGSCHSHNCGSCH